MEMIFEVIAVYAVMSVVTFFVYGWDKFKAVKGMWRTPEATLHLLELLCGWPGAMLAHRYLRHKSIKRSFRIVFWLMVAANTALLAAALYFLQ